MFQLSSSESLNDSSMHELLGMCGIKELVMEMQEPFPLVRGPQVGRQASQEHGIGYGEAACGSLEIFYIYFDWIFEK
jgi:hypothetical protein